MRVFVELARVPSILLPAPRMDPWFLWISYFASNNAVEFAPRSRAASNHLSELLAEALRSWEFQMQAAALSLVLNAITTSQRDRDSFVTNLVAEWFLNSDIWHDLVAGVDTSKRVELISIRQELNLPLWLFLRVSSIILQNESQKKIVIDVRELERQLARLSRIGLAEDIDEVRQVNYDPENFRLLPYPTFGV